MKQKIEGAIKKRKVIMAIMEIILIIACSVFIWIMTIPKDKFLASTYSYSKVEKYEINGDYLTRVMPQTDYETFIKIAQNTIKDTVSQDFSIKIYKDKGKTQEVTYKIKYQNEVEIEKTVISEVVVQEPVNKIVQVQKKVETSRSADLPRTSGTTTTAVIDGETYKITAYCSCSKCCGKTTGRTASGTQATAGRTVAAPSKFAFGTKLNIGGHIYTVEDRGGAIKGNRIDIYVSSHSAALQWGVKYLPVSVAQ